MSKIFRAGEVVRNAFGQTLIVTKQNGCQVFVHERNGRSAGWYHPAKLWSTVETPIKEMKVNVYVIHNGVEVLECDDTLLTECFGDDRCELKVAHKELNSSGRYVTGGGAAPTFILYRI